MALLAQPLLRITNAPGKSFKAIPWCTPIAAQHELLKESILFGIIKIQVFWLHSSF